jgi:hypothetical protein
MREAVVILRISAHRVLRLQIRQARSSVTTALFRILSHSLKDNSLSNPIHHTTIGRIPLHPSIRSVIRLSEGTTIDLTSDFSHDLSYTDGWQKE